MLVRTLRDLAAFGLALLMVLTSFGAALDHHFAERQPGHQHIYLGPAIPEHDHLYRQHHQHLPDGHEHGAVPSQGVPSGGIIYLTSSDGLAQISVTVLAPAMTPAMEFPGAGDSPLNPAAAEGHRALQEAAIAVPKKPPRF
jgi:hypothetical protein